MEKGFLCEHCSKNVPVTRFIGTQHRNQCPFCLWSKHVDLNHSGDRKATCRGPMEPVGLTFKEEGVDKYGKKRQGELMLVHHCLSCGTYSINRIAADDQPEAILTVFENSLKLPEELKNQIRSLGIKLLTEEDRPEIMTQLFGKRA